MTSQPPKQCNQCGTFYLAHQEEDHYNMHIDPSKLAPKTSPNDMKKIQLSKAMIAQDKTDESDIALRSLLPDEIPQPQQERKKMQAPEISDELKNQSIMGADNGRNKGAHNYNRVRDRLDLTSKLANTDLSKDQLNKLQIEKQVEIKQKILAVPKKEIHKFQNSHYAGKQTKDLGGCEKKVPNGLGNGLANGNGNNLGNSLGNGLGGSNGGDRVGSGGPFGSQGVLIGGSSYRSSGQGGDGGKLLATGSGGEGELGYEIKADNSHLTNPSKKSTVVVPLNRKTGNPSDYRAIDTKANQAGGSNKNLYNNRVGLGNGQDLQQGKKNNKSLGNYDNQGVGNSNGHSHGKHGAHDSNGNHLHHHQCPSCHGFYCQHCGSTIPPEYRPFWDPEESLEMVEYYKKRVRECRDKEREKERKLREGCGECHREIKKQQKPKAF